MDGTYKYFNILVCGGRDYGVIPKKTDKTYQAKRAEYELVMRVLDTLSREHSKFYTPNDNWLPSDICIIEGGAKGADSAAADWAVVNWTKLKTFKADWNKYGKSAGYRRNIQMLTEGKPDLVVAFPGGKGTAMMVDIAKKAGVKVLLVEPESPSS